jgi:hypothetical protein
MPCTGGGAASTSRANRRAWPRRTRVGGVAPGQHRVEPVLLLDPARDEVRVRQPRLRVPHITMPPPRLMMRTPMSSNPARRHDSSMDGSEWAR